MEVTHISEITCERMRVEPPIDGMWSYVTRYSSDNWTVTMGESDESIHGELAKELEEAYQNSKAKKEQS